MFDLPHAAVALILLFCSTLQSAVGFAFVLFALPLLLMTGMPVPQAAVLGGLASAFNRIFLIVNLRRAFSFRELLPVTVCSLFGLPIGVFTLKLLAGIDKGTMTRIFGCIILAVMALQYGLKIKPRDRLPAGWSYLAGFSSGIMSGLASIGGPPLVLWAHAHNWSNEKMRVVVPAISIPLLPIQFGMYGATFGAGVIPGWREMMLYAPFILTGGWAGHAIGGRISVPVLRVTALVLLVLICLSAILWKRG